MGRYRSIVPVILLALAGCAGSGTYDSTSTNPTTSQVSSASSTLGLAISEIGSIVEPISYATAGESPAPTTNGSVLSRVPNVTATGSGTDNVTVKVDYGSGTTTATGVTQSGIVTISYTKSTQSGTVSFTNYLVNSESVSGTISLSNLTVTSSEVKFSAAFNISTSKGTYNGTMAFDQTGGSTTMNGTVSASLAGQPAYSITLTSVVVSLRSNQNWVPQAGTALIVYPYQLATGKSYTANILLTFSSTSPSTRQVSASVNGSPSVTVTLASY